MDRLILFAQSRQQVGKAGFCCGTQLLRHTGQTHIRIDQEHALARLRQRVGKVDRGSGLALVANGTGHADNAAHFIARQGKQQVRTQLFVGLRRGKTQIVAQHAALLAQRRRAERGVVFHF